MIVNRAAIPENEIPTRNHDWLWPYGRISPLSTGCVPFRALGGELSTFHGHVAAVWRFRSLQGTPESVRSAHFPKAPKRRAIDGTLPVPSKHRIDTATRWHSSPQSSSRSARGFGFGPCGHLGNQCGPRNLSREIMYQMPSWKVPLAQPPRGFTVGARHAAGIRLLGSELRKRRQPRTQRSFRLFESWSALVATWPALLLEATIVRNANP